MAAPLLTLSCLALCGASSSFRALLSGDGGSADWPRGDAVRESSILPDLNSPPVREAFAQSVEAALLEPRYVHVVARITHGSDPPLLVRSYMSKDRLRTEVFRGGSLVSAVVTDGVRTQEYNPLLTVREDLAFRNCIVEFDAPGRIEVPFFLFLDPDTACEFGVHTLSWTDEGTGQASSFRNKVLDGEFIGESTIRGRPALGFRRMIRAGADEADPPLTITHTIYFDRQTHLPVQWETLQSRRADIRRLREYVVETSNVVPHDIPWTLELESLKSLAPPVFPDRGSSAR